MLRIGAAFVQQIGKEKYHKITADTFTRHVRIPSRRHLGCVKTGATARTFMRESKLRSDALCVPTCRIWTFMFYYWNTNSKQRGCIVILCKIKWETPGKKCNDKSFMFFRLPKVEVYETLLIFWIGSRVNNQLCNTKLRWRFHQQVQDYEGENFSPQDKSVIKAWA